MTEKRKASDVLLEIEKKLSKMQGAIGVIDVNVKSLLNKMALNRKMSSELLEEASSLLPKKETEEVTKSSEEDVIFHQADAPKPSFGDKFSMVEQRIVYSDGRPVILANVKVSDSEVKTNTIVETKTDSHGKWHAKLSGGKYIVEVIKGPTAAKRPFKIEYPIEVLGDGKPLPLERKQVE